MPSLVLQCTVWSLPAIMPARAPAWPACRKGQIRDATDVRRRRRLLTWLTISDDFKKAAENKMMPDALKLDRIDIRILSHLQRNGRVTNVDLADAVGLSPSPCLIRVKRLEKAGYITGYGAHVQLEKLGTMQMVFTQVTLSDHRREDFVKFETAVRNIDEVVECHLVSGGFDYLLKFVTRSVAHYQSIVEEVLEKSVNIEKYFSYIVIKSPFIKSHYPIEKLFSQHDE